MAHAGAAESEPADGDSYNAVLERLVRQDGATEEILVGLIGYGLYKLGKREWVMNFKAEHGRGPNGAEFRAHAATQTTIVLEGYRSQASEALAVYANALLEGERPKIVAEARKGEFWRSFWPSFWASMAFAALLALLVFIAAVNGADLPIRLGTDP